MPINVLITRKSLWAQKKLIISQNKRSHNLETFEHNHKKFGIKLETSLLINCGKIFSLLSKKIGEFLARK